MVLIHSFVNAAKGKSERVPLFWPLRSISCYHAWCFKTKGVGAPQRRIMEKTRREIRRLKPEVRSLIDEAAAKGDSQRFVKWIQGVGNHLSIERQAEIVAQFKQIVADESAKGRRRR